MTDIAGREHWDAEWARAAEPYPFGSVRPDRILRDFIAAYMRPTVGQSLAELGAGNTHYLPGLAQEFGYRVAGLDYSPLGVELARRNLAAFGVDGEIVEADLFDPPEGWGHRFDVVMTFGVVEHFDDTAAILRACARYLAPGGLMLTLIPNMRGFSGSATRWLSRELYDRHVALTPDELADAHGRAGLTVRRACYLVGVNAAVANPGASPSRLRRALYWPFLKLTSLIWRIEDLVGDVPPNRLTSPWVVVVAQN